MEREESYTRQLPATIQWVLSKCQTVVTECGRKAWVKPQNHYIRAVTLGKVLSLWLDIHSGWLVDCLIDNSPSE